MSKAALILKILLLKLRAVEPAVSFQRFLNKTQTEIVVMLTLPVLESYTKMKTLLKVS